MAVRYFGNKRSRVHFVDNRMMFMPVGTQKDDAKSLCKTHHGQSADKRQPDDRQHNH